MTRELKVNFLTDIELIGLNFCELHDHDLFDFGDIGDLQLWDHYLSV